MSDAKVTVFVVDDDLSVRESLKLLIESAAGSRRRSGQRMSSFRVRGYRGRAVCCSTLFSRILNGLDLQSLVADRTGMPIIFITGHGDVPTTVRAMKAGAVEFFVKPLFDDLLVSAIRSAIERSCAHWGRSADAGAAGPLCVTEPARSARSWGWSSAAG